MTTEVQIKNANASTGNDVLVRVVERDNETGLPLLDRTAQAQLVRPSEMHRFHIWNENAVIVTEIPKGVE